MRIYEPNDIRAYEMSNLFKTSYSDIIKFESYNIEIGSNNYFLNYLMKIKDAYIKKQALEEEYIAKKYYEGVIRTIFYVIDHPSYISGIKMDTNKCFNFNHIIERSESFLTGCLARAEREFKENFKGDAAFFIGQYYGNLEIIKICKKYLYLKE